MGLKSVQTMLLPWWCGNMEDGVEDGDDGRGGPMMIRVIGSDGRVEIYHRPVSASEVMKDQFLLCSSDSFFIGQKVPFLSEEEELQLGRSYFLLPKEFFHSVLSFITLATSLLLIINNINKKMSPAFEIHKTDKGMLQIRISEEVLLMDTKHNVNKEEGGGGVLCSTKELEKEYNQLILMGGKKRSWSKDWKPKLETIDEIDLYGYPHHSEIAIMSKRKKRISSFFFGTMHYLLFSRSQKNTKRLIVPDSTLLIHSRN